MRLNYGITRGDQNFYARQNRGMEAEMMEVAGYLNDRLSKEEHEAFWATIPDNAHPTSIIRACRAKLAELDNRPARKTGGLKTALDRMSAEQARELTSHMNED